MFFASIPPGTRDFGKSKRDPKATCATFGILQNRGFTIVKPQLSQNYVFFLEKTPLEAFLSPRGQLSVRCRSGVTGCGYFFQPPADSQIEPKSPQRASGARTNSSKSPQKRIQKRWGANVRLEGVAFLVFLDDTSFQTLRIGLRHCYLQCFLQYSKKSIFAIQT